jgi:hypothetical protein
VDSKLLLSKEKRHADMIFVCSKSLSRAEVVEESEVKEMKEGIETPRRIFDRLFSLSSLI